MNSPTASLLLSREGYQLYLATGKRVASCCCYESTLSKSNFGSVEYWCMDLFCLNVVCYVSQKRSFSKGLQLFPPFFFSLLPVNQQLTQSTFLSVGTQWLARLIGWHATCQIEHIRWLQIKLEENIHLTSPSPFEKHFSHLLVDSLWSLKSAILQGEHWQMEMVGYYSSSKSFNSGCNGLARAGGGGGGESKNWNAFLHSRTAPLAQSWEFLQSGWEGRNASFLNTDCQRFNSIICNITWL